MNTVPKLETRSTSELPIGSEIAAVGPASEARGQARQYHAKLIMRDGHRYCALTDEGAIWVVTAAGCLLQPAVGDIALVSVAGAAGYVLNILERAHADHDAVVAVQGGLRIEAESVAVAARSRVEIESEDALQLRAATGQVNIGALLLRGEVLRSNWRQHTDASRQYINISTHMESHAAYSVRRISTHEEVTAASLRQSISHDWSVRAATATVVGRDRVAIDGDTVQMG